MENRFICIEGNIGAGKTTLARMLSDELNAALILEQFEENPFLPKFYSDSTKFAFPLELSFLTERYHQLKNNLPGQDLFRQHTISDYYLYKSLIFAKATLDPDEYHLYCQLFNIIHERLPKPDLLVYLYMDYARLLENIKKRGRIYEQQINKEYLERVQENYLSWLKAQKELSAIIINMEKIDFVNSEEDYTFIKNLLRVSYPLGLTTLDFSDIK